MNKYFLSEIVSIETGKLDSNAATEIGEYPFFTCDPNPLKIDHFAYDTKAILMAGNNANAKFHLNYFEGKFNAYQRTYIFQILDGDNFCLKFLYYYLRSHRKVLSNLGSGTSTKYLTKKVLDNFEIFIPNKKTQEQITNILSKLDQKIELNEKMNEKLEEITKTLFKSWFIDFDPIRAKAEGEPTGLSKEISDLFPDSFEDSELGDIPKGWKSGNLGDLFEPSRGKIITKAKTNPGIVPVVAGGIKPPYYHSESNVKGPVITISASGTAGYVNLYYQDIWASDCSYVNKDTFKKIFFAHSFLKINQERIYDLRHGAVQQHVYPKDLVELPIVISTDSIINTYEDIASQLHKKIETNLNESETLVDLRDTLLPKLISGELKMPDAQNLLEEADI